MSTSQASKTTEDRGYLLAFASPAILSITAIIIRYLIDEYAIPVLVLAFWRNAFLVFALLSFLVLTQVSQLKITGKQVPFFIGYGLVLATFNILFTTSVTKNGAAISTVLLYCSSAFTVLLARIFLKETLNWAKIIAIVLSLTGCALVAEALNPAQWNLNFPGLIIGLLSGLGYAIYTLMGKTAAKRGMNTWTTIFYTFLFAAITLLVINLLNKGHFPGAAERPLDTFWLNKHYIAWGLLFFLGAGPTLIGFGFYNTSLQFLPSGTVNLIGATEPIFTAFLAYILIQEHLSVSQIIGGVVILCSVYLIYRQKNILPKQN